MKLKLIFIASVAAALFGAFCSYQDNLLNSSYIGKYRNPFMWFDFVILLSELIASLSGLMLYYQIQIHQNETPKKLPIRD